MALLVVVAIAVWRRRGIVGGRLRDEPAMRAFLTAWCTVAVLGFALNDSGIAVPAIMMTVAVPWCIGVMVPVVRRSR